MSRDPFAPAGYERMQSNNISTLEILTWSGRNQIAKLVNMAIEQIVSAIDAEIRRLQEAKQLLSGSAGDAVVTKGEGGRPKGTENANHVSAFTPKRTISAEGRAKIAEAQRKRHATRKRAAKKSANGESA